MHCQNCGAQLADNAKFCTDCGQPAQQPAAPAPITTPVTPAAPAAPAARPRRRYRGQLVFSVVCCVLMSLVMGIPAIVFAAKAIRQSDAGHAALAAKNAKRSTVFCVLSICLFLLNLVGLILLVAKYG